MVISRVAGVFALGVCAREKVRVCSLYTCVVGVEEDGFRRMV